MADEHFRRRESLLLIAAVFIVGLVSACNNACENLATSICLCERTEELQQACQQRADNEAANISPTDKQLAQCEDLLDGCTCEALACGDLAACGLAQDSGLSPPAERRCD